MGRNYHKEAIGILGKMIWSVESCRAILYNIAQHNPSAFVRAINGTSKYPSVDKLIRKGDSKIEAIKELRNITGMTLVDSKNWVEAREQEFGIK